MTEPPDQVEPPLRLIRHYAVRRDDDELTAFVDELMTLVDQGHALIDLSHYDRRGDMIELRVIDRDPGGDR